VVDLTRKTVKTKAGLRSFFLRWLPRIKDFAANQPEPERTKPSCSINVPSLANYRPVDDQQRIDGMFLRLRRFVQSQMPEKGHGRQSQMLFEAGFVNPRRMFFYIKPIERTGLLFERSGAGWILAFADRIAERDLFVRKGGAIDQVVLFEPQQGEGLIRVNSQIFATDLMSFSTYEQRLISFLESKFFEKH